MSVKIGLVGAGTGAKFVAAAVAAMTDAELMGICAPSATRRDPLCNEFGGQPFDTFAGLLAAKPDVAVICSPNSVRVSQFEAALEAGIDTLIDKPLAINLTELTRLLRAAHSSPDRFFGALLQHSFNPAVVAAERFVKEGLLGTPLAANVTLHWGRFGEYLDHHYRMANNDGVILNQSPHALHAALQIARHTQPELPRGEHPVRTVYGVSNSKAHSDDPRCETETTAVGTMVLWNGFPINYSLTSGTHVSSKWTVSLIGKNGRIRVREDGVVVRAETDVTQGSLPGWLPFDSDLASDAPNASANASGSGSSYHRLFIEDFLERRQTNRRSAMEQLIMGSWSTSLGFSMQGTGHLQQPSSVPSYFAYLD
ncbi:MAG: Gfo/Idh/MocA family oxidoreductase [Bdellovibrionota bacterium]